jgi:hypothetical protein
MANNTKFYKNTIENLEQQIKEEKEDHQKLLFNVENKEGEFSKMQKGLEKLRDMYENKLRLLNNKILQDEEGFKEIHGELSLKNEVSDVKY